MTTQTQPLGALTIRLTGDEKHSFAVTSARDVLQVLYDVLDVSPDRIKDPDRDRDDFGNFASPTSATSPPRWATTTTAT